MKGKLVFIKGPRSLPRNPPNCTILDNWVFENFILADEPFAKTSQIFETYVLVNNNLCGKLVSSLASPTTFYETFIATWMPSFIPDFNSLSCKLDDITFKVLYCVILQKVLVAK